MFLRFISRFYRNSKNIFPQCLIWPTQELESQVSQKASSKQGLPLFTKRMKGSIGLDKMLASKFKRSLRSGATLIISRICIIKMTSGVVDFWSHEDETDANTWLRFACCHKEESRLHLFVQVVWTHPETAQWMRLLICWYPICSGDVLTDSISVTLKVASWRYSLQSLSCFIAVLWMHWFRMWWSKVPELQKHTPIFNILKKRMAKKCFVPCLPPNCWKYFLMTKDQNILSLNAVPPGKTYLFPGIKCKPKCIWIGKVNFHRAQLGANKCRASNTKNISKLPSSSRIFKTHTSKMQLLLIIFSA